MNYVLRNIAKLLLVVMFAGLFRLSAQTNNFGIGTLTPHQSSVLHLYSTTKGFLIPRMTEAERLAIPIVAFPPSPATGLMVYQTDATDGYYYWDGTQWLRISTDINVDYVYGEGDPGQVAYWRTSSTLTGSDNLFWDYSNTFLGIGTTTPLEKVDVNGGIIISNTSNTFPGNIRWTGTDFEGWVPGMGWMSFTSNTFFGSGATGQVTWWLDHTHLTGDNDLFWDIGNARLGIGTNTPLEALHVNGGMIISSTTMTVEGNVRWTGTDFEGWNGVEWKSFTKEMINGHGEPGQVTFWEPTDQVSGDWGLFWDMTNLRLGIGTTTPRSDLEVNGAIIITDITNVGGLAAGTFRWTGADFEGWMGTEWKSFTTAPSIYGGGQPGQVTVWLTDTPPTLTGDFNLFWDWTNGYLGVKTSSPQYEADVKGDIMIGINGSDGQLRMYSEQGATDYEVVINPNPAMTMNTNYILPASDGEIGQLNLISNDGAGTLFYQDPTLGFSLLWIKPSDVVIQKGNWALGNNQPGFNGTYGTHLLFGRANNATVGSYNTILNGLRNTITAGNYNIVYTGTDQSINGNWSTILGGSGTNSITGDYSILFGYGNTLSGSNSIIAGGQAITLNASGSYAFKGAVTATTLNVNNTFYPVDVNFFFNANKSNADFRIDGQATDYLFFMDASADAVGIGTSAPVVDLDVNNGDMAILSNGSTTYSMIFYEPSGSGTNFSSFSAASQTANLEYTLPIEHDSANSILVNDGFGILEWADPAQFAQYLRSPVVILPPGGSATYTAKVSDNHIFVNNDATKYIYLPLASSMNGKEFFVKKVSNNASRVYIVPSGSDKLDDATGLTFYCNQVWEGYLVVSDGTEWYIMANFR